MQDSLKVNCCFAEYHGSSAALGKAGGGGRKARGGRREDEEGRGSVQS